MSRFHFSLTVLFTLVLVGFTFAQTSAPPKVSQPKSGKKISTAEMAAASELAKHISASEWMGPLAPVALSPFFGIACLSGLAIYGGDWVPMGNALLENSVLKNPSLFWTFLVLAILTSLPRLTKVSKPIAQALDQVEAYAGIITLLIVRLWVSTHDNPTPDVVVQLGVFRVTLDVLLSIAAVFNILVVNSVKFFFEFLIWITPIPFLDACFEIANKTVCAVLLMIYAYSPTAATILNLLILGVCLIIFRWIHKQLVFYRTMSLDPILAMIYRGYAQPTPQLVVFPQRDFGPFGAKDSLIFERIPDGWRLRRVDWFSAPEVMEIKDSQPSIQQGWLTNTLWLAGEEEIPLTFSHRHTGHWNHLCEILVVTSRSETATQDRKAEFA